MPLTPALLRLDPMFDGLRNDPRFQTRGRVPARVSQRRRTANRITWENVKTLCSSKSFGRSLIAALISLVKIFFQQGAAESIWAGKSQISCVTCRYRQALCDPKLSRNTTLIVLRKSGRHFQDADFASPWSAAGRFCGQRERLTADSRRKAGVVQAGNCALQLQRASEPISRAPRRSSMCRTDGSLNHC